MIACALPITGALFGRCTRLPLLADLALVLGAGVLVLGDFVSFAHNFLDLRAGTQKVRRGGCLGYQVLTARAVLDIRTTAET